MNKIFTLVASLLVCTLTYAQKPEAEFTRLADTAPVLDGEIDAVWDGATQYDIGLDYTGETPTVGNSYFKVMYADSGIFVLIYVDDDVHVPWAIQEGGDEWTYDKTEVYFDVNDGNLVDGNGSSAGSGHYQFAPGFDADDLEGGVREEGNFMWAIKVTEPTYVQEYFIPFSSLIDENSLVLSQFAEFGFDVYVCDRDGNGDAGSRQRKVWSNIGTISENYGNMDDAGLATFLDPSDQVYVDEIILSASASTIDVNNGTVEITAEIDPADATVKELQWIMEPKGIVSIDGGVVTAIRNGEVTIMASSTDGGYIDSNPVTITISNQILTMDEANVISNGNFDNEDDAFEGWGGWTDGDPNVGLEGVEGWSMSEGWAAMPTIEATDGAAWHYQFNQAGLDADPDVEYTLQFKAYASEARPAVVDFEDIEANGHNRYGASTDPRAAEGRSEWLFDVTTDPMWFTFDVVFDQIEENTVQKLQYMLSNHTSTFYLDSVYLIKTSELDIIEEEPTAIKKVNATEFSVYPNPVGASNMLTVDIQGADTKVYIFNTLGQKLIEKNSTQSSVTFDVSGLQKGIYIIRLEDGSTNKFIR